MWRFTFFPLMVKKRNKILIKSNWQRSYSLRTNGLERHEIYIPILANYLEERKAFLQAWHNGWQQTTHLCSSFSDSKELTVTPTVNLDRCLVILGLFWGGGSMSKCKLNIPINHSINFSHDFEFRRWRKKKGRNWICSLYKQY